MVSWAEWRKTAKGALRICTERGLPGVEGMRRDELRTLLAAQPDFANVNPRSKRKLNAVGTSFYLDLTATLSACTLKCAGHM